MAKINPAHPGRVLHMEFMAPYGISNYRLAKASGLSETLIGKIVKGKASVTANVALRLEGVFGVDAQTWLNMQNGYDLLILEAREGKKISKIVERLDLELVDA
jgi:addiction module HigA family antidote